MLYALRSHGIFAIMRGKQGRGGEAMRIVEKKPIHKGWSKDRKYRVKDEAGETYLLRISDISQYEAKYRTFLNMRQNDSNLI